MWIKPVPFHVSILVGFPIPAVVVVVTSLFAAINTCSCSQYSSYLSLLLFVVHMIYNLKETLCLYSSVYCCIYVCKFDERSRIPTITWTPKVCETMARKLETPAQQAVIYIPVGSR